MKAQLFRYLFLALLAVASRVQAEEAGTSAGQREAALIATAPAQAVALSVTASDSTAAVEGNSNSGAMAPAISSEAPQCGCNSEAASPTTRIGTPNDAFAQQVWSGP